MNQFCRPEFKQKYNNIHSIFIHVTYERTYYVTISTFDSCVSPVYKMVWIVFADAAPPPLTRTRSGRALASTSARVRRRVQRRTRAEMAVGPCGCAGAGRAAGAGRVRVRWCRRRTRAEARAATNARVGLPAPVRPAASSRRERSSSAALVRVTLCIEELTSQFTYTVLYRLTKRHILRMGTCQF